MPELKERIVMFRPPALGKFCVALKDLSATDLRIIAARAALERSGSSRMRSIM